MGGVVPNPFKSPSAPAPAPAPTTAEVSQASATDATQTVSKRRRGKSPTILTDGLGSGGSLNTESKTLLGG
jgi:hypothetical protein